MESQLRQNYHRECEGAINKMINMELYASYVYTSMVSKKKIIYMYICVFIYEVKVIASSNLIVASCSLSQSIKGSS